MRSKRKYIRKIDGDVKFGSVSMARFINYIMLDGKKTIAEKIVYDALDIASKKLKKESLEVFEKAIENVSPQQEVISKRVGGANYQIPMSVRPKRQFFLACKWIIDAAKVKKGKAMTEKLAEEIINAFNNEGVAITKKENVRKMAEANKAFAHFAR